jgi:hypothetical protein
MFRQKKYIELPDIKIKYWDKTDYPKIDIEYLKTRSLLPEAILNEALVLGYTKRPAKEFKELLMKNKDVNVVDWDRVAWEVIIKIIKKIYTFLSFIKFFFLYIYILYLTYI